jgi:DNA-binding Lrp family transcriptional regulator
VELDDLDRRIVGALQVDGRASWRRIAEVIDAPFSTVTRRGSALLASGAVRVVAIPASMQTAIMEVTTTPQRVDAVARALAFRPDTVFVYAVSAPTRIIVEEQLTNGSFARAVIEEIPAIEGVTGVLAAPVLDYYRTLTSWMPGLLSASEVAALNEDFGRRRAVGMPSESALDRRLQSILERDGRVSVADIAVKVGQSESGVRRRLAALVGTQVEVRAVVAPALLGLRVSAFVWIRVAPAKVQRVAEQILESPFVRYAAMTMGDHQLIVDVAVESLDELRRFLTEQPWATAVESIRSSPVLAAYKRSGVIVSES